MDDLSHDKSNCDDKTEAVLAANELIDRMQDKVAAQLKPDSHIDREEGYGQLIEELETAPEIERIREGGEQPTDRFGTAKRTGAPTRCPEDHPS